MADSTRIAVLAHNIRSLWNVGSLFRTCDTFSIETLYLTGYTPLPPRREISKTALGAEEWVQWKYSKTADTVIQTLRQDGWSIVALERTDEAEDLSSFAPEEKVCLLLGHEVMGVPKHLLDVSDYIVSIPMYGKKESLNVSVAAGIALHTLRVNS